MALLYYITMSSAPENNPTLPTLKLQGEPDWAISLGEYLYSSSNITLQGIESLQKALAADIADLKKALAADMEKVTKKLQEIADGMFRSRMYNVLAGEDMRRDETNESHSQTS